MSLKTWPTPKSRNIGLFTDLRLFSEAMELAYEQNIISKQYLMEEMPQRVKGLLFVKSQSSRGVEHLLRELRSFRWLLIVDSSKSMDNAKYRLTDEGRKAFKLSKHYRGGFLRLLTTQMHNLYTIPGWFVHRLWVINPEGQGEIVIPTPPRDWSPKSRKWEDKVWTDELAQQTKMSLQIIESVCAGAFPIEKDIWIKKVRKAWNRLSDLKRKKVSKSSNEPLDEEKEKIKTYAPRLRLSMAMQEAAVKHLFSNEPPNSDKRDFSMSKNEPLYPRTYMAWCPRLESLELIFYTDVHPLVPGRLIFPTSVFRSSASTNVFEELNTVKNPYEETLWLHRPGWDSMKKLFFKVLIQEHRRAYTRFGSLYVPLLDVRDEVCRQLRLSAACFDNFMEKALRESLHPDSEWSISVETDIREDQRSAHRLIRRPVWIGGIPHSLIAITEIHDVERIAQ